MRYLLTVVVMALALGGCSLLTNQATQGQVLQIAGLAESLATCIQQGVRASQSVPAGQARADAVTQASTSCVNQYEPAIVAAAQAAKQ